MIESISLQHYTKVQVKYLNNQDKSLKEEQNIVQELSDLSKSLKAIKEEPKEQQHEVFFVLFFFRKKKNKK